MSFCRKCQFFKRSYCGENWQGYNYNYYCLANDHKVKLEDGMVENENGICPFYKSRK